MTGSNRPGPEPRQRRIVLVLGLLAAAFLVPEADALAVPWSPSLPGDPALDRPQSRPLLARRRSWSKKRRRARRKARRRRRRQRRRATQSQRPAGPARHRTPAPGAGTDAAPSDSAPSRRTPAMNPSNLRRGGRVEFDGRLVQGQTAKSGAIYLFARKRSQLRSMVEERVSYRKEVLRTVFK